MGYTYDPTTDQWIWTDDAGDSGDPGGMTDEEYQKYLDSLGTKNARSSDVWGTGSLDQNGNYVDSSGASGDSSGGKSSGSGMSVPLLSALSGLLKGQQDAQMSEEELALRKFIAELTDKRERDLATQSVASKEAGLNPFRQQMDQAGAVSKLDMLERSRYTPTQMQVPAGMQKYMPSITGGTTYEKSPEAIAGYAGLKKDVLSGHTAPTMTNPANYGKTAALNLLPALTAAGTQDPALAPPQPTGVGPGPALIGAGIDGGDLAPSYADLLDESGASKKRKDKRDQALDPFYNSAF